MKEGVWGINNMIKNVSLRDVDVDSRQLASESLLIYYDR
jgi:hypothetical protein